MRRMRMTRTLMAALASLVTLATGMGASMASVPSALTAAEAALVRGGNDGSGDCNVKQTTLHGCRIPDSCADSLATNCNGSCTGACMEVGVWTDNYATGSIMKKIDINCGNERTGANCTKLTAKNKTQFCGCSDGMDSGAVGTCGVKKGLEPCR